MATVHPSVRLTESLATLYDQDDFVSFGGGRVNLTERRKQFLQGLIDLYHRTRLPVHYETLANRIGVSKWTAYDMLKQLEKLGLLTHDYAVTPGETGRSQVVFAPTAQAEALFAVPRTSGLSHDDLGAVKAKALRLLQQLKGLQPAEATRRIMSEIHLAEARVTFCAYLVGLLLIHLRSMGEQTGEVVRRLVSTASGAETRLTMFVGAVLGAVIQPVGHGVTSELADLVGRYLKTVSDLTEHEQAMLVTFLEEGLAG